MTRSNLEHIIRAAGTIADDTDIVVIGSQAVLGQHPDAPAELLISMEADVWPRNRPERTDMIDGSIGEGSPFQREFGYYAHGVDSTTAVLPRGWESRLVLVTGQNTRNIRGWCLEPHDLAVSKLVAGRPKDVDFLRAMLQHRFVDAATLRSRLAETEVKPEIAELVKARLERLLRPAV